MSGVYLQSQYRYPCEHSSYFEEMQKSKKEKKKIIVQRSKLQRAKVQGRIFFFFDVKKQRWIVSKIENTEVQKLRSARSTRSSVWLAVCLFFLSQRQSNTSALFFKAFSDWLLVSDNLILFAAASTSAEEGGWAGCFKRSLANGLTLSVSELICKSVCVLIRGAESQPRP